MRISGHLLLKVNLDVEASIDLSFIINQGAGSWLRRVAAEGLSRVRWLPLLFVIFIASFIVECSIGKSDLFLLLHIRIQSLYELI